MAYDLEEQEQIDAIKSWWNQYGTLVLLAVCAALVTVAAFQGWRYYKGVQANRSASLYAQLNEAQRAGDTKRVRDIAAQITDKYSSTEYAGMAALIAAKAAYTTGERDEARRYLQWAVDKGKDEGMRDIARLRLAGVLLDEKKYDDALKLLSVKTGDAYAMLYADLRGDVLSEQGKAAEARAAYQAALEKTDAGSPYRRIIEVKLDALGEAK